jgi:hypothetical protein
MCSLYLRSKLRSLCRIYESLHVCHFTLYMLLWCFVTVLLDCVRKIIRIVFVDGNVILRSVLRNLSVRGPWNVRVTYIFFVVLWILSISGDVFLWSIPVFSFVINDSRYTFVLHFTFYILLHFIYSWGLKVTDACG